MCVLKSCQEYRTFDHVRLSAVSPTSIQPGVSTNLKDRYTIDVSHETIELKVGAKGRILPDVRHRPSLCLPLHRQRRQHRETHDRREAETISIEIIKFGVL